MQGRAGQCPECGAIVPVPGGDSPPAAAGQFTPTTMVLDDVFGIERTGKQDAVFLDRLAIGGDLDEEPVGITVEEVVKSLREGEPSIEVNPAILARLETSKIRATRPSPIIVAPS